MDTQRKRFISRSFYFWLFALALLCCANFGLFSQSAMAQEGNRQTNLPSNLPTRLPRPGRGHGQYTREDTLRIEEASSPLSRPLGGGTSLPEDMQTSTPSKLPADGRPFALGV